MKHILLYRESRLLKVYSFVSTRYAKESHKFDTETTTCDVKIECRFNVILLDPPRAGIDPVTLELAM